MIDMIKIEVEKSTRKVVLDRAIIGNDLENLQDELEFSFKDEFVNGAGRLDYELPNGDKGYIPLTKVGETYTIPLRNVLMKEGLVYFQIVITQVEIEEEIPVFKSNTFYFIVSHSINAEEEAPDDYQTWIDLIEEKIAEVENLNINAERVEDGVEVNITDKQGNTKTVKVFDGEAGTTDYEELENKPSINGHELNGNKSLEDLGIDQDFVKDDNYVHTDNNFTNAYKQQITTNKNNIETLSGAIEEHDQDIQNIKNDIDTLEQDIDSLGTEIDNLELNKQNKLTAGTNITIDANNVISATGGSGGTSDFDQLTNRPKYNGLTMTHLTNIPAVPTKTSDLTNDSNFVSDADYVHTDNNFTSAEKTKLGGIEAGAEVNNVNDVQINGTSIVENKVANIPLASNNALGVVKNGAGFVVGAVGSPTCSAIPYENYVSPAYNQYFISKKTLENVIEGKHLDRPEVKTALDTPLQVNTIYDLDDVASLTLQLPQGQVGDFLVVQFVCKTTATALSITSAYGMTDLDLTPEVGNTYSIYGEWGKVDTDTYGWKLSSFEASIPTI